MEILIVDDEPGILQSLETYISMKGHEVTTTDSPKEALELQEQEGFDLALLDINMPELNGLELLKLIREVDYTTEVVMITGFNSLDKTIEAREKGAVEYLLKPFDDMEEIGEIIWQASERQERWKHAFKHGLRQKRQSEE